MQRLIRQRQIESKVKEAEEEKEGSRRRETLPAALINNFRNSLPVPVPVPVSLSLSFGALAIMFEAFGNCN